MITLTNSVINPTFIEEAYTCEATERSPDGGWYICISNAAGTSTYWTPTKVVVVVHYASGRSCVYGGIDANCIWVALHGTPAYVESQPFTLVEGDGMAVYVRGGRHVTDTNTFDWVSCSVSGDEAKADTLLQLLVRNGFISKDEILPGDEATLENGALCLRCFDTRGKLVDTITLMSCTPL